jgi:CheY-like chemotaxis protein
MSEVGQILVVDDDEGIREFVELALSDEGYQVATASHGAAALEFLVDQLPAVILLDMRMPIMDGWAFARAYRQRPGPHAPIIVVTAAREAADRAKEIGAEGVLSKPFFLAELLAAVEPYAAMR